MTTVDDGRYAEALRQIARIATESVGYDTSSSDEPSDDAQELEGSDITLFCWRTMALPLRLRDQGAVVAAQENPVNAPLQEVQPSGDETVDQPLALTLSTSKYWGPKPRTLSVSFVEPTAADLRARIVSHMNVWSQRCGISFTQTAGTGDVRISRGSGGYWSYLGTDIRLIPSGRQTMNLQGFTMGTSEREFRRVVCHETGHTMGFPHEHMRKELVDRIDPQKAYAYFARTQGWSRDMVDRQVLTPLSAGAIMGTPPDQDSIMCYQLPGLITRDGRPIRGGTDVNQTDFSFAERVYPRGPLAAKAEPPAAEIPTPRVPTVIEWGPEEDVVLSGV